MYRSPQLSWWVLRIFRDQTTNSTFVPGTTFGPSKQNWPKRDTLVSPTYYLVCLWLSRQASLGRSPLIVPIPQGLQGPTSKEFWILFYSSDKNDPKNSQFYLPTQSLSWVSGQKIEQVKKMWHDAQQENVNHTFWTIGIAREHAHSTHSLNCNVTLWQVLILYQRHNRSNWSTSIKERLATAPIIGHVHTTTSVLWNENEFLRYRHMRVFKLLHSHTTFILILKACGFSFCGGLGGLPVKSCIKVWAGSQGADPLYPRLLHFIFFLFLFSFLHACLHDGDLYLEDKLHSLVYVLHVWCSLQTRRAYHIGRFDKSQNLWGV